MPTKLSRFQSFWHGAGLSPYEQMCIRSFLDHGHEYDLYSFETDLKVPDGCNLIDARLFFKKDELIFYREGPGKGSVALFANLFRYKLLYEKGGWWVDTDVVCMTAHLPEEEYVFGFEDPAHNFICNAILKMPANSALAHDCLAAAREIGDSAKWGETGPKLLTLLIRQKGLENYVRPFRRLFPYRHQDAAKALDPDSTSRLVTARHGSPFIHLWNETFRRNGVDKLASPPAGSFMELLFRMYLTEKTVIGDRDCLAAAFAIDAPLHERLANALIATACLPLTRKYIDAIGSAPNFIRPRSYTEKMQSRKLFDRNPLLRVFCDKLATRDYITAHGFDELLTPLLWSGPRAKDIPFDDLSPPYIIKPSQRSGHNFVVRPGEPVDRQQIRKRLEFLLSTPHGVELREWGYAGADPQVLVEQLLPGKQGAPYPQDYRVTVFSGEIESIRVISRRQNGGVLGSQFSAVWEPLDQEKWAGYQPWPKRWIERHVDGDKALERPRFLDKMVETAKSLSGKIDHLRVDFYETDEQLFLGELTPYHGSGHMLLFAKDADYRDFPPRSIDYHRGELWKQQHWPLWQKLWRAWAGQVLP